MAIEERPIVNQWYRHLDKGYRFQVTAVDEKAGAVEIRHFGGDTDELDLDQWPDLDIEPTEPPEDWPEPMDETEREELGYGEVDMRPESWGESLVEEAEHPYEGGEEEEEGEEVGPAWLEPEEGGTPEEEEEEEE
ncbi:MAG TPA: DUF6763 family protein [Burkholderiales bacterium]